MVESSPQRVRLRRPHGSVEAGAAGTRDRRPRRRRSTDFSDRHRGRWTRTFRAYLEAGGQRAAARVGSLVLAAARRRHGRGPPARLVAATARPARPEPTRLARRSPPGSGRTGRDLRRPWTATPPLRDRRRHDHHPDTTRPGGTTAPDKVDADTQFAQRRPAPPSGPADAGAASSAIAPAEPGGLDMGRIQELLLGRGPRSAGRPRDRQGPPTAQDRGPAHGRAPRARARPAAAARRGRRRARAPSRRARAARTTTAATSPGSRSWSLADPSLQIKSGRAVGPVRLGDPAPGHRGAPRQVAARRHRASRSPAPSR